MKFGVCIFPTAYSIQPAELAVALEERGFESLWVPEHTHIPASRKSPWPGGAELPRMYYDVYDPFIALAAAASVTKTLKLATGVTLACQHSPLTLAKTAATLDRVSNGRLLLGVGGGWNREELEDHGRPFDRRWKVLRETVEAMKALWGDEPAEYHGEFVDFAPAHSAPTPVQRPHPPSTSQAARRMRSNAWLATVTVGCRFSDARRGTSSIALRELRELVREGQRDPDRIEISIYACPPEEELCCALRRPRESRARFSRCPPRRGRRAAAPRPLRIAHDQAGLSVARCVKRCLASPEGVSGESLIDLRGFAEPRSRSKKSSGNSGGSGEFD